MAIVDRIKHAWNAFTNGDNRSDVTFSHGGGSYSARPDRTRMMIGNEQSIISSIYTRLGIDCAAVDIRQVRLDAENRYLEDVDTGLNYCLTTEANIDQAASAFRQDVVMTLFDRGTVAIVPVDTTINPAVSGSYDIKTMRVGHIVNWYPQQVRVNVYDERDGQRKDILLDKSFVAIVENPLYSVMNERSSTLQRLIRKLSLLDQQDDMVSSGKLDLIVQLPYVVKNEARKADAERRRNELEQQLRGSKYGVAYTDGTEKITQLNRPVENTLLSQIQYLTDKLYVELGLTPEVMNGSADEATMKNYYNRTIEPVIRAVVEAMKRTFITKTARSQGQSIMSFRDPFKLVPINEIADIADKFARNEIMTSNELRQIVGLKPSKDPKADKLINSNMPQGSTDPSVQPPRKVPSILGSQPQLTPSESSNQPTN